MSKHQQNKTVFYDIRPPYGAVFQMNIDGSVKLVFNPEQIDKVEKWVEDLRSTFGQIVQITQAQQRMAQSPLDRPVRLDIKGPGVADLPHNKVIETQGEIKELSKLEKLNESQDNAWSANAFPGQETSILSEEK